MSPPGSDSVDRPPNRLAILMATPWSWSPKEQAMHHDIEAIVPALRRRGFRPVHDFCIVDQGRLDRDAVLRFLHEASLRISDWRDGEVFLYVTGHGRFEPDEPADPKDARLAVWLTESMGPLSQEGVFWDEIVERLHIPSAVRVTILPDT
jgi:hypothetical protein